MSKRANGHEEYYQTIPAITKTRDLCAEDLMGVGAWTGENGNRPSPRLHHCNYRTLANASEPNLAALEKLVPKYDAVAQFVSSLLASPHRL